MNKDDQFISIQKLLKYDETRERQQQEIVVKGECLAGIDVCEQRKFWITPINVSIKYKLCFFTVFF